MEGKQLEAFQTCSSCSRAPQNRRERYAGPCAERGEARGLRNRGSRKKTAKYQVFKRRYIKKIHVQINKDRKNENEKRGRDASTDLLVMM
jgi:hypothetical protein